MIGLDWVNSFFPESYYLPTSETYYDEVARGYDTLKNKSIIICGICKNIGPNVRNILARIKVLGEMFNSYSVFVYENDSTDNTLANLANYADLFKMPIEIQSEMIGLEPHEQDKSLYRRQIMAQCRNKYLDYLKSCSPDYVIVLDLDIYGFSYQGVAHSFSQEFDVMGSNGIIYQTNKAGERYRCFYDTWAYRGDGPDGPAPENLNLLTLNRGEPCYEVDSCFGGLAIYKQKWLDKIRYMDYDCDHVTLHEQIRESGGKIMINPSQIVLYGEDKSSV